MTVATAQELRAQINKASTADDITLEAILSAAERTINRFCNRPDGFEAITTATARLYAGSGRSYQFIDECVAITLVEVKNSASADTYDSWASGDWIAFRGDPASPDFNSTPYTGLMLDPTGDQSLFVGGKLSGLRGFRSDQEVVRGVPTIRVTAKWGYAVTVPDDIKEAVIMQAARWFKRLEGAMADALASADMGQIMYRQVLDPDIKMILVNGRYVRPVTGRP